LYVWDVYAILREANLDALKTYPMPLYRSPLIMNVIQ
jgi:hypothetical protein